MFVFLSCTEQQQKNNIYVIVAIKSTRKMLFILILWSRPNYQGGGSNVFSKGGIYQHVTSSSKTLDADDERWRRRAMNTRQAREFEMKREKRRRRKKKKRKARSTNCPSGSVVIIHRAGLYFSLNSSSVCTQTPDARKSHSSVPKGWRRPYQKKKRRYK